MMRTAFVQTVSDLFILQREDATSGYPENKGYRFGGRRGRKTSRWTLSPRTLSTPSRPKELSSVILVGHSFGGLAISGVADAMPDRIRHLVCLEGRNRHRPRRHGDGARTTCPHADRRYKLTVTR
jgi:hypothetical protein